MTFVWINFIEFKVSLLQVSLTPKVISWIRKKLIQTCCYLCVICNQTTHNKFSTYVKESINKATDLIQMEVVFYLLKMFKETFVFHFTVERRVASCLLITKNLLTNKKKSRLTGFHWSYYWCHVYSTRKVYKLRLDLIVFWKISFILSKKIFCRL